MRMAERHPEVPRVTKEFQGRPVHLLTRHGVLAPSEEVRGLLAQLAVFASRQSIPSMWSRCGIVLRRHSPPPASPSPLGVEHHPPCTDKSRDVLSQAGAHCRRGSGRPGFAGEANRPLDRPFVTSNYQRPTQSCSARAPDSRDLQKPRHLMGTPELLEGSRTQFWE